jgi:predicted aspartyl protease
MTQGEATVSPVIQASLLLAWCIALLLPGCTTYLRGVSGAVAWRATDLRVVERSVAGAERDIYAFTLVLEETQGTALTFTQMEYTISQPDVNPAGITRHATILWKLRPRGELRQPFSFYWFCTASLCQDRWAIAPWYSIVLTGTNNHGQPVRTAMALRLPPNPPKPRLGAPPVATAAALVDDLSAIPFRTAGNSILVHAVLNQQEQATLLLDTGATQTFLTPDAVRRLGISPTADTPKRPVRVIGGRQVEAPFVQLATITVGPATRHNLQVGVLESFPNAALVDGLLGEDFLQHFTMTLDHATSRLRLTPREAARPPSPTTVAAPATAHSAIPLYLVGNRILVQATLNHTDRVLLVLDTGLSQSILTPAAAQRLGISLTADTPRRTIQVADGQPQEVPLAQLLALAVGAAVRENLTVGITAIPHAAVADGLLGVDFLGQFKLTLDRTNRQMWLEPYDTTHSSR